MKALKLPLNAEHLIVLENTDRFVFLEPTETAIVVDDGDTDVKVTVHYPKLEEDATVPVSVMLAACVKEFLHDPSLVELVQKRIHKKEAGKQA